MIDVRVICSKKSSLELTYPDTCLLQMTHTSGTACLICIDVISRRPRRSLEVFDDKQHLFWEGTPDSLISYDNELKNTVPIQTYLSAERYNRYANSIIGDAYYDEVKDFFVL